MYQRPKFFMDMEQYAQLIINMMQRKPQCWLHSLPKMLSIKVRQDQADAFEIRAVQRGRVEVRLKYCGSMLPAGPWFVNTDVPSWKDELNVSRVFTCTKHNRCNLVGGKDAAGATSATSAAPIPEDHPQRAIAEAIFNAQENCTFHRQGEFLYSEAEEFRSIAGTDVAFPIKWPTHLSEKGRRAHPPRELAPFVVEDERIGYIAPKAKAAPRQPGQRPAWCRPSHMPMRRDERGLSQPSFHY